ncbi:hypothetical protein [Nocardioides donggukensis]|uniref:Thioesterase family protein n=1 Tax=Nocardioides donggukensis TaxID=2774019 RepID=A0A927K696_9ACTN|nr:hypothetical protein [Nocardioides donggukensis]MBD8870711.1 hypothetical protein [Nocardioides donggukensis]
MTRFPATSLTVSERFCGPPDSGNGGWTAGALAGLAAATPEDRCRAWPTIEATLRMPPPLGTPLSVSHPDTAAPDAAPDSADTAARAPGARLHRGEDLVAEVRVVEEEIAPVEPVSAEEARAAVAGYPGLRSHPFPTCFVCGTAREEGDGLRIFPGPVAPAADGSVRVAAPWTPHPSTGEDFHEYVDEVPRASLAVTWAALDCTGGWAGDLEERLMVLGRMTAEVDDLPVIGEPHVVVGQRLGSQGRKTFTATTLYDADDRVVGRARQIWIAIDPTTFG